MKTPWAIQYIDVWGVAVILCLGLIVTAFGGSYILSIIIFIGIYSIFSVGYTLILGYADQLVLCANAFMGIGAYASAILTARYSIHPILALAVAAAISGCVAFALGITLLRLKGLFLGMTTLAFALVFFYFVTGQIRLTGGSIGFPGIPHISIYGLDMNIGSRYVYFVLLMSIASLVVALNLANSRFGQTLRAIGSNETASVALGIDAVKYKNRAFIIHAVYSSIAGSLYAHYLGFIDPEIFGFNLLITVSAMVILGGMYSVWGGVLGAAIIVVLGQVLRDVLSRITGRAAAEYELMIYGLIIIVTMMRFTHGLAPGIRLVIMSCFQRFQTKRELDAAKRLEL
jgi:branched-chain amino acid transport system permease protein